METSANPPPLSSPSSSSSQSSQSSDSDSDISAWDPQELRAQAECLESEELAAMSINNSLLPILDDLLLQVYTMLRPKPLDYEQRTNLVHVFNNIANQIFGNNNGFPVVEAFGSFTMDLFTPRSDLDLSVNFTDDTEDKYARKKKISVVRKIAKRLYSHQRNGIFCGVLPVVTARVPIVNVIDRGTGIECDITVENKDGMTRSMIFKFISSLDPRFQILSYLVKFWAKIHDVNSPRERTMSSMSIISLVAFHLQQAGSTLSHSDLMIKSLADGSDFASVERNALSFEGFGSKNKETVAELFLSLISKLLSADSLWEHGLCASNFEASWISKTWKKGVGNLNVEDFLDRSQNFARSVGKKEMQKISRCLRDCALNFLDFMRGKLEISKLKILLFGRLKPYELVSKPRLKCGKRKHKAQTNPNRRYGLQKEKHVVHQVGSDQHANFTIAKAPQVVQQHPTQAKVSTQCVNKPKPWLVIIPSGFGYSLSVQLPVAPQLSRGLLGPPPPFYLAHLNNGAQLQQQGPLLPLPSEQAVGSNSGVSYAGAQQLQRSKN
uniref:Poly(A) RNA polymerase mitochondrial-like central palm domain-containing protein n=1 Tax=Leersia perrieri TaxID=77586 RepID=A0A0D9XH27_9ORYZ